MKIFLMFSKTYIEIAKVSLADPSEAELYFQLPTTTTQQVFKAQLQAHTRSF